MKRAALISVSDRTGLKELAKALVELDYTLLCTSGSGKYLQEQAIEILSIEEYTGQKEILDGRVKTLHPKIHAGLLAKRDNPKHMSELEDAQILPIDIAVVNLYPFTQNLNSEKAQDPSKMIELVDIGGPTMIRAAAKNHKFVLPLIDPNDYQAAIEALKSTQVSYQFRVSMACKVFAWLGQYNLEIGRYFSELASSLSEPQQQEVGFALGKSGPGKVAGLAPIEGCVLERVAELRYGENPHQRAGFYRTVGSVEKQSWNQIQGKQLSYNNLLDFDATLRIVRSLGLESQNASNIGCVIVKHLNPCGVALADSALKALKLAKQGDPRSHFGGILGFNTEVTLEVAEEIREGFAEIVFAPSFADEALNLLKANKNLRLLQVELAAPTALKEMRVVEGGVLVQQFDEQISVLTLEQVVSKVKPTSEQLAALNFAWKICAHVKSNAIVIARTDSQGESSNAAQTKMVLSIGAGQMSRVDSAELAISKAKTHNNDLNSAVAASDAFFPFADSVEALLKQGITAIVAPKGAKRDQEVIDTVDKFKAVLLFVEDRHFRH